MSTKFHFFSPTSPHPPQHLFIIEHDIQWKHTCIQTLAGGGNARASFFIECQVFP